MKRGNINSTPSEETHNLGGVSGDSPFASWTRDPKVAKWWAEKDGPGGVVLATPTGASKLGDAWAWKFSPDAHGASEVLLQGSRSGLKVFDPNEL